MPASFAVAYDDHHLPDRNGLSDTDLTRGIDGPKSVPDVIVARALDGVEAGAEEVLADERTQQVRQALSAGVYLQARA